MANEPRRFGPEVVREFQEFGLLALVNMLVLHPRGYALAVVYPDEPGDGEEPGREGPYISAYHVDEPWSMTLEGKPDDTLLCRFVAFCQEESDRELRWTDRMGGRLGDGGD